MKALLFGLACVLFAAPAASAAVSAAGQPVVVVYPFTVSGPTDPEAGGRLAVLFATELAQEGGLNVKPATPGTDRAHFLSAAVALGADYYVTGFVTPLGDEVSLVDQIVSTYSGIVVWSDTKQIRTYEEAAGQADLIRAAILRHAGRTLAQLDEPAPKATTTPPPTTTKNSGNFLGLFGRKPKATPAPAASGTPVPGNQPPAAGATRPPPPPAPPAPNARTQSVAAAQAGKAIVVGIGGTADSGSRTYASSALAASIAKAGLGGALVANSTTSELPARAKELCAQHGATAIYSGTLALRSQSGAFSHTANASFDLLRYDCAGAVTGREHADTEGSGKSDTTNAIDRAVAKSLEALQATQPKRS
jgi:TolB-like protein